MRRAEATDEYLSARQRLFDEMLAVTKDLDDALAIEEVTSDSLSIIDSLIEAREKLMREINQLDAAHRGNCETRDALDNTRQTLGALVELQGQIEEKLERHRARAKERIKDARRRKNSVSGYYNSLVASRPRYVDARK